MPLPAPTWTNSDTFALNGRAQLQWAGIAGAETYNFYRGGVKIKSGLPANLYIDFGLTNGTAYSYTVSAVDGNGVAGAQSAAKVLTPSAAADTNFRYRQVLGILLRYLIVMDGLPAINAAFAVDQAAKGLATPLLTLAESAVTGGPTYAVGEPTISVIVKGRQLAERFTEGVASYIYHTQIQFTLATPTGAAFGIEDREFIGNTVAQNLKALLGNKVNSRLPSLSPITGNWMLPGCGVFHACDLPESIRLNQVQDDKVTRVPCWLIHHAALIEISQSDLML